MSTVTEALQLAVQHRRANRFASAESVYRKILQIQPEQPDALHGLGVLALRQGDYQSAEQLLRAALKVQPASVKAWFSLGNVHQAQAQWPKAVEAYQRAIVIQPNSVLIHHYLGSALQQQGHLDAAVACYQKALGIQPNCAEVDVNLGNVLHTQGKLPSDQQVYYATLNHNLGILQQKAGNLTAAVAYYRQAIALEPDLTSAHYNLGTALQAQGKLAAAVQSYHHALSLNPDYAEPHNNLANVLQKQGKFAAAVQSYHHALSLNPDCAEIHCNLGNVLLKQGKLAAAVQSYHHALSLNPDCDQAKFGILISQLPIIYSSFDEIQWKRTDYQQHLQNLAQHYRVSSQKECAKAAEAVGSFQPFLLAYQGLNDRPLQKIYGEMICQLMSSRYPQWSQPNDPSEWELNKKIRIGFVSGFFRKHSNWKIPIKGWVQNLNRKQFELFGYHTSSRQDQETEMAAKSFVQFIQGPLSLQQWCEAIIQDNLHVLIFPEFGMDPMTVELGCLRLAPIQLTSWGHPETSGLPTIDYYLSSDLMEPQNAQDHYTETLVRLPNLSIYYTPLETQPKTIEKKELKIEDDEIMFWCCQSLYKYLPQHDDVFPRIAKELTSCKFIFIKHVRDASEAVTDIFCRRLSHAFQEFDLNYRDHCRFLHPMNPRTFAGVTASADIFLDSIGWSGCNSTLESIAFNLPIVTFPGDLMRGRHTMAILKMMGVEETIASSKDDYVKIAIRLGQEPHYRQRLSQQISENKHKLYGDLKPIRALEDFLLNTVNLNQQPSQNCSGSKNNITQKSSL